MICWRGGKKEITARDMLQAAQAELPGCQHINAKYEEDRIQILGWDAQGQQVRTEILCHYVIEGE